MAGVRGVFLFQVQRPPRGFKIRCAWAAAWSFGSRRPLGALLDASLAAFLEASGSGERGQVSAILVAKRPPKWSPRDLGIELKRG